MYVHAFVHIYIQGSEGSPDSVFLGGSMGGRDMVRLHDLCVEHFNA